MKKNLWTYKFPLHFSKDYEQVFCGIYVEVCDGYLDDILIYSKDHEIHLVYLTLILQIISQIGFTANGKKYKFIKYTVEYLGFEVFDGKIILLK